MGADLETDYHSLIGKNLPIKKHFADYDETSFFALCVLLSNVCIAD